MPDLEVSNLSKSYEGSTVAVSVLRGADLSLMRGESAVITGPSGIGKSTLLYLVGLLEPPSDGAIELLGKNPLAMTRGEQATFRNDHIGFVFQDHHLLPQCNVLENVLLPLLAHRSIKSQDEVRAKELLGRVGLAERATHRPAQLSGGERQRAALCRALINQPELVLADEPTGNLDAETATNVGDLLLELARETNVMLLCVTHSLELANRFPRQLQIRDGKLVDALQVETVGPGAASVQDV